LLFSQWSPARLSKARGPILARPSASLPSATVIFTRWTHTNKFSKVQVYWFPLPVSSACRESVEASSPRCEWTSCPRRIPNRS
jgi:hypothetical protein